MVGRSQSPADANKVFVRGLTDDIDESSLQQVFGKYGRVAEVYVARNYETKQSRGFAFVTYENGKDCEEACKALDGKDFRGNGKVLHVERSVRPRGSSRGFRGAPRGGGFGGRGGRGSPSRDYGEYRPRDGAREERGFRGGGRRPYYSSRGGSRGGRGRGSSPPPRDSRYYDYAPAPRSPPPGRSERYYAEGGRGRHYREPYESYSRGGGDYARYESGPEYRPTRPRGEYSPVGRRDYDPPGRGYGPPPARDYYDGYPPSNGRYSPPPPRREYEPAPPSRGYDSGSRYDGYGPGPSGGHDYSGHSSYPSRMEGGYSARSPPPRGPPREYGGREVAVRRPAMRSVSPPPKRIKAGDGPYDGRRSPRGGPPPRRF